MTLTVMNDEATTGTLLIQSDALHIYQNIPIQRKITFDSIQFMLTNIISIQLNAHRLYK